MKIGGPKKDEALYKGIHSISVVETMQPINDTEMNFSFKIVLKNQTHSDLNIEWVEPVFQGVMAKSLENKELRQQVSKVFKNDEMIITNDVKLLYQQGRFTERVITLQA